MKRKFLSLILVFAMTVSLLTVGTGAVEPTYGDTAGHWAESSIERWSAYGIIQGSNGLFDPNGQLTCAQLATILAKLLKLPAAKDAGFTDNTADAWYYDAINRCAAAGILNGNGDGTVTPEAPITRERAMVMLARALGIEPIRKPDLTKYTDAAQVSAYAQGYLAAMIKAGIVGGVGDNRLAPQDNINRASTVTILDRAISTYADQAGATVKADGKGLVLVVAENVKITGAPEGTKIVVADGATGLTVNGKSVSDDQTYIVPKTEPAKPSSSSSGGYSHSHSYNDETHKCSCGQFDPAVVATIGNTNGYLTLKDAVAAAQDGDTVKLVKSGNGNGVIVETNSFTDKGLTVDFSGYTYTVGGQLVGSSGTGTNAFQLKAGNKITFKNGNIVGATEGSKPADDTPDWHGAPAIVIQNYCDLTLDHMVVTGGDETVYTMSNNCGNVVIKDSTINIGGAKGYSYGPFAFDVYGGFQSYSDVTVTVEGSSVINGKIEVARGSGVQNVNSLIITGGNFNDTLSITDNAKTKVSISGGTFNQDVTQYCADGYEAKNNDNGTWTVREKADASFVAQIGGVKYTTLAAAITAAQNGDTVKLVGNETVSATVAVDKNLTLDLGGNTLTGTNCRALHITSGKLELTGSGTVKSTNIAVNSSVVRVGDNNGETRSVELVIGKDVVIDSPNSYGVGAFGTVTTETLTIYGTVKSTTATNESYDGCAVTTLGTDTETPATIIIKEDAKISAVNTNAVYLPAGTLTVEGGEITGTTGIYFKSTNMTISGGTITGNGTKQDYKYYGNGGISTGEAVTIDSCNYPGGIGSVSIRGGEFSSTHANAIGSYNSNNGLLQTNFVTGGTFSSDPSEYVAEGYIARENNGKYVVSMVGTAENPYTLTEFNALTKLPAGRDKLYVDLGNASLQNGLTIGNDNIADHYYYGEPNSTTAPEGFPHDTGRTDNDNRHIYSTGKDTVTVVVTGSVTGATDTGDFNAGDITLKVPDAANVIFDTVTFGEGQMAMSMWTESHVQSMTVSHRLASVTFKGCTFKGNWLQNGAFGADEMTITGCTFEKYENTAGINSAGFDCKNNSNPIWIQNMGQTNVTIEGCTFNAVRPIKLWEGGANGSVTIRGNTFNMEKCSIDDDNTHKNIAIMFCGTTAQVKLGNVEISGNTVTGDATSLICFYNGRNAGENHYPAMNEGATFSLYNNILPEGTTLSVIWRTATVWAPTYVPIPQ